jgi:hypothetical protein
MKETMIYLILLISFVLIKKDTSNYFIPLELFYNSPPRVILRVRLGAEGSLEY